MKQYMTLLAVMILAIGTKAQGYQPVDDKSSVKFVIKNFRINTGGDFKGLEGAITWETGTPEKSSFDISVKSATVNTGMDSRDNHLRKEEYFDVEKHPKISFKSEKVARSGKSYTVSGKLTIKATTRDISIPFTVSEKDGGLLFDGSFKINRKDYGVGGSSMVLSDDVTITLSVFAVKK